MTWRFLAPKTGKFPVREPLKQEDPVRWTGLRVYSEIAGYEERALETKQIASILQLKCLQRLIQYTSDT